MSDASRFYPSDTPVPERLHNSYFSLEPLTPAHTALDYVALMESREMLRLWSGSPWPRDEFTEADNRADLARHAQEHQERSAFTYTVLHPDGAVCLGCVYINSFARLVAEETENSERLAEIGDFEAAVRFWVTAPRLTDGLDRRLLDGLRAWFAAEWPFRRVLYHTRALNEQQLALFWQARLVHDTILMMPRRGGAHHFWAEPVA